MRTIFVILSAIWLSACGGGSDAITDDTTETENNNTVALETNVTVPKNSWQMQLTGDLVTTIDADLYDVDLYDTSAETISSLKSEGRYVVCYFSAGSFEDWRSDADEFPASAIGNPLDGWEGENWLDVRNNSLLDIMEARMDLAVSKGCDGVDPDNVDGYTNNTGFALTYADQLTYNIALSNAAHERSLSIGLKNDLDQIEDLVSYFDFAVNEQCHAYDECEMLSPFVSADKAVFNIEYDDIYVNNTNGARDAICSQSATLGISTLIMPDILDGTFRITCE